MLMSIPWHLLLDRRLIKAISQNIRFLRCTFHYLFSILKDTSIWAENSISTKCCNCNAFFYYKYRKIMVITLNRILSLSRCFVFQLSIIGFSSIPRKCLFSLKLLRSVPQQMCRFSVINRYIVEVVSPVHRMHNKYIISINIIILITPIANYIEG